MSAADHYDPTGGQMVLEDHERAALHARIVSHMAEAIQSAEGLDCETEDLVEYWADRTLERDGMGLHARQSLITRLWREARGVVAEMREKEDVGA